MARKSQAEIDAERALMTEEERQADDEKKAALRESKIASVGRKADKTAVRTVKAYLAGNSKIDTKTRAAIVALGKLMSAAMAEAFAPSDDDTDDWGELEGTTETESTESAKVVETDETE